MVLPTRGCGSPLIDWTEVKLEKVLPKLGFVVGIILFTLGALFLTGALPTVGVAVTSSFLFGASFLCITGGGFIHYMLRDAS